MSEVLHVFEYLAYIVPGSVLLYAVLWLSPELQAPLIEKNIDLGSRNLCDHGPCCRSVGAQHRSLRP